MKINFKRMTSIIILILLIIVLSIFFYLKLNKKSIQKMNEVTSAESNEVEATYQINEINDTFINITILFESNLENIEYIITPVGNKIYSDKKKIAVDYNIENGINYIFKVKSENEGEENFTLIGDKDAKPKIEQSESYSYPTLYDTGVEIGKYVTVDYGSNTNNYYSLDNGKTWSEYNDKIKINNEGNLLAKSKVQNEINKVSKQYISINLAEDAIPKEVYDDDISTGMIGHVQHKEYGRINIDSSMWGKDALMYVYTHWNHGSVYTYAYDQNGRILNSTSDNEPSNKYWWKTINIPSNTLYLILKTQEPNARIMEIKPQI